MCADYKCWGDVSLIAWALLSRRWPCHTRMGEYPPGHRRRVPQGASGADVTALRAQGESGDGGVAIGDAEAIYGKLIGLTPTDPVGTCSWAWRGDGAGPPRPSHSLRRSRSPSSRLLPAKLFRGSRTWRSGAREASGRSAGGAGRPLATPTPARRWRGAAVTRSVCRGECPTCGPGGGATRVTSGMGRPRAQFEGYAREAFGRIQAMDPTLPTSGSPHADVLTVTTEVSAGLLMITKAQPRATLPACTSRWRALRGKRTRRHGRRRRRGAPNRSGPPAPAPVACGISPQVGGRLGPHQRRPRSRPRLLAGARGKTIRNAVVRQPRELRRRVEGYVVRAGIARDQNQPIEAATQTARGLKLAPGDPTRKANWRRVVRRA